MKYLLVLAVLWVAIWLWRKNRREEMRETLREEAARAAKRPSAAPASPQAMLRCAHCGLHLPASDAIAGPGDAVYCSAAHRQAAERG
ncbi:hypothetical protein GmRootV59_08990 [Variovorax sp. V59]|uniref:PP0621 family protein n=1 Tax=unclassified Variovorax TaxID=663243 RepID=UPI0034E8B633